MATAHRFALNPPVAGGLPIQTSWVPEKNLSSQNRDPGLNVKIMEVPMPISRHDGTDKMEQPLFTVDPVSSFEYDKIFNGRSRGTTDNALRGLMLAVLEDAIDCFQSHFLKPSRTNETRFRDAEDWIMSDQDALFSFNTVCEGLGIDSGWLRARLLRWKENQPAGSGRLKRPALRKRGKRKRRRRTIGHCAKKGGAPFEKRAAKARASALTLTGRLPDLRS